MSRKEFDLMTRKRITLKYAKVYRKATSKKEKSRILTEFVQLTGYNRCYASYLLRNAGKKVRIKTPKGERVIIVADPNRKVKRKRRKIYNEEVLEALIKIWTILGHICSLRLKAMLPRIVDKLEAHGEFTLTPEVKEKLLNISKATIDRLLAPVRKRVAIKSRSKTKPGSLLKKEIAIKTHFDWEDSVPGYLEIDLISHDGGVAKGEFAYTLVITDVATEWTIVKPLKNRARKWVVEALEDAKAQFPFKLKGIDSDNDSAFINYHLKEWCEKNGIIFTRSRPYWKNDNCHVEQKNWSIGRRYFGYFRYDTPKALEVMKELGEVLSHYVNYFQPSVKLLRKVRKGPRVRKIYDEPQTPYERVLKHPAISEEEKARLREIYEELNPAELFRLIVKLQKKLYSLATPIEGVYYE